MLVDVWVSRDEDSGIVDVWDRDPGELADGVFDPEDFTLTCRLGAGSATRLGYGVAEGCKRHVVGEVGDAAT